LRINLHFSKGGNRAKRVNANAASGGHHVKEINQRRRRVRLH